MAAVLLFLNILNNHKIICYNKIKKRKVKVMGLFGKKDKKIKANGLHVSGLNKVLEKAPCRVTLEDEFIVIEELTMTLKGTTAVKTFNIPLENVLSVEVVNEENVKELSKSVVKRGIAGGVLFGPAGLILGGLSGAGKKEKKEKIELLCVSYQPSDGSEIKTVILQQYPNAFDMFTFVKEYKKKYPEEVEETVIL